MYFNVRMGLGERETVGNRGLYMCIEFIGK